jgi:hypothetical protein
MRETDRRDFNKHGRDTMVNNDKSNWREYYDWTDLNDEPVQDSKKKEWIQLEFDFGIMETIDQSLNMRQA